MKRHKKDNSPLTPEQKIIVESNLFLIEKFMLSTNKMVYKNDIEGFKNELALALITAVKRFDPNKGAKLATFVIWYFRAARSAWMYNKKKIRSTKTFGEVFSEKEIDQSLFDLCLPNKIINSDKLAKFRQILDNLPVDIRNILPLANKIFGDYQKPQKYVGHRRKKLETRLKEENNAILFLRKAYFDHI